MSECLGTCCNVCVDAPSRGRGDDARGGVHQAKVASGYHQTLRENERGLEPFSCCAGTCCVSKHGEQCCACMESVRTCLFLPSTRTKSNARCAHVLPRRLGATARAAGVVNAVRSRILRAAARAAIRAGVRACRHACVSLCRSLCTQPASAGKGSQKPRGHYEPTRALDVQRSRVSENHASISAARDASAHASSRGGVVGHVAAGPPSPALAPQLLRIGLDLTLISGFESFFLHISP